MAKRKCLPRASRMLIWQKYGKHCAYCGKTLKYEDMQVDHLIPVYRGGKDTFDNYMPACRACNYYKKTFTLEEFREQLGLIRGRLKREFIYNLALAYGIVQEIEKPVRFYFEKRAENDLISDAEWALVLIQIHLGNTIKHISRVGRKDPARTIKDLRKAAWYLNRQIQRLERAENE